MTERTSTIKVDIIGGAAAKAMLSDIVQQRNELLKQSKIRLNIDAGGVSQAQRAMAQTRANALSLTKDMSVLGDAVTSKAVAPMAQYSAMLGAVLLVTQKMGPGLVSALQKSNVEFNRQRDLMRFWGTSGYLSIGIDHFKSNLAGFVSTSGSGFTKWLQNTSAALSQYRTALAASAAVMVGMATAAALSSKSAQNYIQSTLDSRLMQRKLSDRAGAEKWIQSAEGTDWSAGRESRMGAFQTILSKNPYMGQTEAQKGTEDLEKFFFANQEMLKKKGFESVEALASAMSAPTMSGEDALKFEDIFGLGFQNLTPRARLGRVSTEAGKLDMAEEVGMRPEEILTKRFTATTRAMGDAVLPPLLAIMNMFVKLSDIVGKIPGLGGALGWAAVLAGIAAAGLTVISVLAGLAPALGMVIGLVTKASLVTKGLALAQWALNVALTANPIGVAVVAIVALIGVLYLLEKKFGIVTKAWNALKAGMSSLGGAFKDAGGMGVLKIGVEALVANNPMLKILLFQFDLLKKIWLGGETLNKIMGGAMTIWQQIGQFFSWLQNGLNGILAALAGIKDSIVQKIGGAMDKLGLGATTTESGSLAPTAANKEKVIGELKAKKFDNGKKVFDFSDELWEMIAEEALTGEPQQYPAMAEPGKLERARNAAKQYVNNPNAYPGAITAVAAGLIDNPTGPLPTKEEKKAWSKGEWTGGGGGEMKNGIWVPAMASGGTITGSGSIIGHAGEEVSPASAVVGAKTTLARMSEAAEGGLQTYGQMRLSQIADGSTRMASGGTITLERMSEAITVLKNIWLGGETLNKIMAGAMTSLTENIGGFLGDREEKAPLSQPERDETIQWAKDLRKAGGTITGSGSLIGHAGEEVSPASAVVGAKSTLERVSEAAEGGRGGSITVGSTTININVDKMSSDIDLERALAKAGDEFDRQLMFRLRNLLDTNGLRGIGYMRG